MSIKDLADKSPKEIAASLYEMAESFADKAETIYDADPENNGTQAQPYADVASMLISASHAWEPESNDPDGFFTADDDGDDVGMEDAPSPAPSQTVRSSPWGRRTKNPFSGKNNGS